MNRNRLTLLVTAALFAAVTTEGQAQGIGGLTPSQKTPPNRAGTRGANFLELPIGARANAMGGAVSSFVDDGSALYWNVAGLAAAEQFSAMVTRQNLYTNLDIRQNFASAALPLLGGAIGVSVNALNSGDIPRTSEGSPYGSNVLGQTFQWTATAISLGYARRITDRLDVGFAGKYIGEGISNARTSWGALDFGTQFRTGIYGLVIGAAIQNVGPASTATGHGVQVVSDNDNFSNRTVSVQLPTRETDVATVYRFGIGLDVLGGASSLFGQKFGANNTLIGEMAVNDAIDTAPQLAFGAEYGFRNLLFLRGGKRFYNDDRATGTQGMFGLSGGVGVRLPVRGRGVRFDYGYTSMGDLDNVQVFTFELGR